MHYFVMPDMLHGASLLTLPEVSHDAPLLIVPAGQPQSLQFSQVLLWTPPKQQQPAKPSPSWQQRQTPRA
jgi:hypothetical protein